MIHRVAQLADESRMRAGNIPTFATGPYVLCFWMLLLIGLVSRFSPLFDIDGRLFWQHMTEDGYLMQTIARNIANGLGMTTSEGTIPTNGVQPLATFLFAAMHFFAGGSKLIGTLLVTLVSTLVSGAAAYFFYRVGEKVLGNLRHGRELAMISAASWFAAPQIVEHSMNGLETGVYYLALLYTLNFYLTKISDALWSFGTANRLVFGLLLGLTFCARNDAVFFIAGLLAAHLFFGGASAGGGYRNRLTDCLVAGITSILVSFPWLVYNYSLFGSIMPISGIAESYGYPFGHNLPYLAASLHEAAFLFVPIPRSLEILAPVILASIATIVISVTGFWYYSARLTLPARRFFVSGMAFVVCVGVFYGLFFGATHFLARYVSALSPFLWLSSVVTAFFVLNLVFRTPVAVQRSALALLAVLMVSALGFAGTNFAQGTTHMHMQVVNWVKENVPETQWVGAVQTGTLGFFHDRTINLDGKVNPDALRARMQEGHVLDYVVRSKINYIADWVGVTDWTTRPESPAFAREFAVVVKDVPGNLGVLKRRRLVE